MEMEYFVPPGEAAEWYRYWVEERYDWHRRYGIRESHLRIRPHDADELSHYSSGTSDIEYLFPIGWSELEGIANRGDFDLTAHTNASGTKLEWVEQDGSRYTPHVIEPALGVNRSMLAFLVDAYDEEVVAERERTVLRLHPQLAPVKAAILPLIAKNDDMTTRARKLYEELRAADLRRVRRRRPDRPALPPPGRDRHAVRAHDRRPDARGRHGHDPRPRLARAGADLDRPGPRAPARPARGAVGLAEDRFLTQPGTLSCTVGHMRGIAIMLCVALPLAAADLFVKATAPTADWAYHQRSLGWLALSIALFGGMVLIARVPSLLVAPAAGVLAAGVLGNCLSAAYNQMEVPNPARRERRRGRRSPSTWRTSGRSRGSACSSSRSAPG